MDEARGRSRAEARAHLATTIESLLCEKAISRDELAARAEVDRMSIDRVLSGEAEAQLDLIYRLAGALGIEPRRLFEGITWVPGEAEGGRLKIEGPEGG